MHKYKELFKNFSILAISNFGSKFLGFLLIPLYTFVLTTEEYGNYDFIYSTISLLLPILTICISDATMRFLLDKNNREEEIVSITFKYLFISFILILAFGIANKLLNFFPIINKYLIYFILYYITYATYYILQNTIKGFDDFKSLGICGILNSILIVALNLLFLLVLKLGLSGYFMAYIISNFITCMYLLFKLYKKTTIKIKIKSTSTEKEMVKYSKPMIINTVGWWINNLSDRYIVIYFCGVAMNGIYSLAYKIPTILNTVQAIFNQAWTVSAVKELDKNKDTKYVENMFELYNFGMVFSTAILISLSKIFANILFNNEFYIAWIYIPFLSCATMFGAISGFIGSIYIVFKDSKTQSITTIVGAIANIIFNIILIYYIGTMGAAISTIISYIIILFIRYICLKKYISLKLNIKKTCFSYLIVMFQSIVMVTYHNNIFTYLIQILSIIAIGLIYYKTIYNLILKIKRKDKINESRNCNMV